MARLALLLVALVAVIPAVSGAQDQLPQCSDGVDNDSDNTVDGADAGCAGGSDDDETDSIYAGIKTVTIALPLVNLQGSVKPSGVVNVTRLQIRARQGTTIAITCTGKHCPVKELRRTMLTTTLRLTKLEGKLRPTLKLKMRIARPGQLGKYVSYKVRRNKPPVRYDTCIQPEDGKLGGCFGE